MNKYKYLWFVQISLINEILLYGVDLTRANYLMISRGFFFCKHEHSITTRQCWYRTEFVCRVVEWSKKLKGIHEEPTYTLSDKEMYQT